MRASRAAGRREMRRRGSACEQCLRRSWLLGELSRVLDCNCRADGRLGELLALDDSALLKALAGRRRAELEQRYARFQTDELPRIEGAAEICVHDGRYPRGLTRAQAPRMLHVAGGVERLRTLTTGALVTILASRRASDYGITMARSLARGLSACGVTVASELEDGIAAAAQAGALEAGGASVLVLGDGLGARIPARRRSLYTALIRTGCAVSELPCGASTRIWGAAGAKRTLAAMAGVTIVIEAEDSPRALLGARTAQAFGRTVCAVPGRVSSRVSCGPHALLREGAHLIRDVTDVLDALYEAGMKTEPPKTRECGDAKLTPWLSSVLERVGAGLDTPSKLAGEQESIGKVLQALGELELLGHLTRGDGGRYLLKDALARRTVRYGSSRQMEP